MSDRIREVLAECVQIMDRAGPPPNPGPLFHSLMKAKEILQEPTPIIQWVKNDPRLHAWFEYGSRFLVALQVKDQKTGVTSWDFDVIYIDFDGEGMSLRYDGDDRSYYDKWEWTDFEFFMLLEGVMPTANPDGEGLEGGGF